MRCAIGIVSAFIASVALCDAAAAAIILATEGNQFGYLRTGPGSTGAGPSGIDITGDFGEEQDIAVLSLSFSGGGTLSFDYNVLTSEVTFGVPDVFQVTLDGSSIREGAIEFANGGFPIVTGFAGPGLAGPDGSTYVDGQLGWSSFSTNISDADHLLTFFIGDDSDDVADSALLVDNIRLDGTLFEGFEADIVGLPPAGPLVSGVTGNVSVESGINAVPEPATAVVMLAGIAVAMCGAWRHRRNTRPG